MHFLSNCYVVPIYHVTQFLKSKCQCCKFDTILFNNFLFLLSEIPSNYLEVHHLFLMFRRFFTT